MTKPLFRAQIFASPPPPLGGVASIVNMLKQSLDSFDGLGFSSPLPKISGHSSAIRPFANLFILFRAIFQVEHGGRILFFSSSGFSFFEKLVWSTLARYCSRAPVIVMVDGHFPAFWSRLPAHVKCIATFLLRNSHATLGLQSKKWSGYFKGIFPFADSQVVGATVCSEFFVATPWQDINPCLTILFIGWIIHSKGVMDLMQAFAQIKQAFPDARLRLIGPYFDKLKSWQYLASSLGILDQTDFVGPVADQSRLIAEFQNATLFVLPSHAEGLPVVLLEAMSLGLPCIASAVGSVPDLFDNSSAGFLVPPCKPSRLALAMKKLLSNNDQRRSLARNALLRARSHYGETQFISSYQKLLCL